MIQNQLIDFMNWSHWDGPDFILVISVALIYIVMLYGLWMVRGSRKPPRDRVLHVFSNEQQPGLTKIETKMVLAGRVIYHGAPPNSQVFLNLLLSLNVDARDVVYLKTDDRGLAELEQTIAPFGKPL